MIGSFIAITFFSSRCRVTVHEFSMKNSTTSLPRSFYSPDLASGDFFLFPRTKKYLKTYRFADVSEIKPKETLESIKNDKYKGVCNNGHIVRTRLLALTESSTSNVTKSRKSE